MFVISPCVGRLRNGCGSGSVCSLFVRCILFSIALLLLGLQVAHAQERDTRWQVGEIYLATMGYAPDAEGLNYWVDNVQMRPEWTPTTVAQSFFDQPLVQQQYPDSLGSGPLIEALYQNLFGRQADAEGYNYWLSELQTGRVQRNQMIIALINGGWANTAAAGDMARFGNRMQVALVFADYQDQNAIRYGSLSSAQQLYLREAGRGVLDDVTASEATVATALARIPDLLASLVPTSGSTRVTIRHETAVVSTPIVSTAGAGGGSITIAEFDDPLYGLDIVVPEGATNEQITFSVSSARILEMPGLPAGAAARGRLIRVEATGSDEWNTFGLFDKAIKVTLPYDPTDDLVAYYVYNADGSLEPAGMEAIDTVNHTITFWTRTFANASDDTSVSLQAPAVRNATQSVRYAFFVAVGLGLQQWADWTNTGKVIDTGFRSDGDGWYIPNYGSYYKESRGGNCFGMVGFAKYYFRRQHSPTLLSNYRDAQNSDTWVDDATAIQLASRVHNGMADIWSQFVSGELNIQTPSSSAVARSLAGALYVTGAPALLGIYQEVAGNLTGGHAILTYRSDIDADGNITFHIYDPNFPKDDTRRIKYVNGTGFENYLSGTTAATSAFSYNNLRHLGFGVGLSDAVLDAVKTAADADFNNDSVFPLITISSITGKNIVENVMANEGTTSRGQHKYIASDNAVTIKGTVLGGLAQTAGSVVDTLRVLTPSGNYAAPINNVAGGGDGTFSIEVPLLSGENMIVLLAARASSFSHWAAFGMEIIDSTASPAGMTVTLTWGQNDSDVDLYVKEPDAPDASKTGDIVWYSHRRGASLSSPYLDFDNTSGYGPEHYIAKAGMKTLYSDGSQSDGLYGDYKIGVHYYYDHDSDYERTQPITWRVNWRYLAYCPSPCDDPDSHGFWVEGSRNGSIGTANPSADGTGGFYGGGASWSDVWTMAYPKPDPTDYVVPPSHDVMLP